MEDQSKRAMLTTVQFCRLQTIIYFNIRENGIFWGCWTLSDDTGHMLFEVHGTQ